MGMRSVASLTLQIGPIIGIPVKVYLATDKSVGGVSFRQVHKACGNRIERPALCRTCNREIQPGEIGKAYELTPTQVVPVSDEELKSLRLERDGQMSVETFIAPEEIDPTFFDGGVYRLMPSTKDTVAFVTFRDALAGRYALAKAILRDGGRERVVAIRADGRALAMHFLRAKAEVRAADDMPGYDTLALFTRPEHVALMSQLIESHPVVPFEEVAITTDRYVAGVRRFLAEKLSGLPASDAIPDAPAAPAPSTADLEALLRRSLAERQVA
jgi:DNA end-binding protein Ku